MEQFKFEALSIDKLIAHTVHARTKEGVVVPPQLSDEIITLDVDSRDLIQVRVTDALGSASHGIEIYADKDDADSFMQKAASAIRSSDVEFVALSKQLATDLTDAQTNPKWPGGVLIVLKGKVGVNQKPYVAAIKAETDKGFNIVEVNGSVSLALIKKMLLSQTQRLYKIGLAVEMNYEPPVDQLFKKENYRYFLFDHLLTSTETKSAAAYFYNAFLGMNIVKSSKFQTKKFYEETRRYINSLPIPQPERIDLLEALRSELRSNKGTVSFVKFADEHLPKESKDDYVRQMNNAGLPDTAIVKDLAYIKAKLRRPRRLDFSNGIKIQVPADLELAENVKVGGLVDGYTDVKIKGVIEGQE
ncbi:nucleoid-associated protein [Pseudomonas sp. KB-10]|uniref:nucleoid-associated protein n=1 Tax=Pseudomonas sp. KB-10 TaxID=2292264 RepID=UPI001BAFF54F|nr:nucleoid-associated protein [Pseudomonas sp. KB-10]